MVEQIIGAILDGKPAYPEADGHRFLASHTRSKTEPVPDAAVNLHGRGTHPDRELVAHTLRTGLSAIGWDTLSLLMPQLEKMQRFTTTCLCYPRRNRISMLASGVFVGRAISTRADSPQLRGANEHGVDRSRGHSTIDAYHGVCMRATDYRQPMQQPWPFKP